MISGVDFAVPQHEAVNFSPHELQSFYCFTYSTTQKPVFAWVISKIRCINYRIATRGFWLSAHAFKQIKGFLRYEIIFSTYIELQNLHRNLLWKAQRKSKWVSYLWISQGIIVDKMLSSVNEKSVFHTTYFSMPTITRNVEHNEHKFQLLTCVHLCCYYMLTYSK